MFGIQQKMAHAAKRAGLLSGGLLLCAVGAGFLTVAAWFALIPVMGLTHTALIIAGTYLGLGLILVGLSQRDRSDSQPSPSAAKSSPTPQAAASAPPLVEAFMYGLRAGAHVDRARR